METLAIRIYEGRKLLYDKHGKLENKSNVIKIGSIHYEQKFLKYYHTLGNVKVVIEDIYKDKNGEKLKMKPERIAELKAMLDKAQTEKAKVAVTDSVAAENEGLKARLEKLEALIKSQAEAKNEPTKETTEEPVDYSRMLKADLIALAKEKGVTVPDDVTKKVIIELLK